MEPYRFTRPSPGADEPLLTGSDDAVVHEDQHREPLMGDLLANQRLQQGHLVHARAQGGAQHFGCVQAAAARGHVELVVALADVAQAVVAFVLLLAPATT